MTTMKMKKVSSLIVTLLIGAGLGAVGTQYLAPHQMATFEEGNRASSESDSKPKSTDEPLYWVAPMDPNYQRDKPGKSPMGMDLVPVYAQGGDDIIAGTVTIDPAVENNLGVKIAAVQQELLEPRIETVGYVAFDESQLWQTNIRVSGWVKELYVNAVGERVKQGEVLFTLYSPELVKAQEELLNAQRTGRKALVKGATERLVSLGVDRQQVNRVLKRGKATQTIEIKAVADGVIASLNIREGGFLSPAQAAISAGPLSEVWVDAEVFERQAHWIKAGSHAVMNLDALPGEEWQGSVDYVYPILDPKTRTLRVRLKFDNSNNALKPNMFANIALQPQTENEVLTVPREAVIRSGGMSRVVLAEGEGKYRSARVVVGREAADRIEILQGLTINDSVVTSAHFLLDSESSLTADLSRINGTEDLSSVENHTEKNGQATSVWTSGEITDVMADNHMLTISHQPVPEWQWPGMVMNFNVASNLELKSLRSGQAIDFEIRKTDSGQYEIINYQADDSVLISEMWVTGDVSMLMADFGMITIQHLPVAEWSWDAGEMNFTLGADIDLSGISEGDTVRFLVEKKGSDYVLKALQSHSMKDPTSAQTPTLSQQAGDKL